MKPLNKLLIVFLPVIIIIIMLGCNNKPKGNTTPVTEVNKTDSSIVIASPNVNAGAGTETTSIPVYAIWVSKKQGNRTYDGLYDSTSGYIRLCESKQLYHIDDRSEIAINASNNCFNMGTAVRMIIIRRDSAAPLFLSVLHVDSMGKNLVGLTDNNDTIMTSVGTMNRDAFEKLKMEYRVSNFKQIEIDKIKQYYLPEMKRQNMEKKERIMKASAVIKR